MFNYELYCIKMTSDKVLFDASSTDNFHPGFSIDCVIFSFYKKKLQVLLNKFDFSRYWQLPGGFMLKNESSDNAAARILNTRTGLSDVYLKQFYLFSDPDRTITEQNQEYINGLGEKANYDKFLTDRFVSLGYCSLVKYERVQLSFKKEDTAKWFDVKNLPALYADHKNIIDKALEHMYILLPILPIGYALLPEKFTMSELRKIYEIVLNKSIDRRNFQRKVLASGIVIQLDETKETSPYNPPILYSFKPGLMDDAFSFDRNELSLRMDYFGGELK